MRSRVPSVVCMKTSSQSCLLLTLLLSLSAGACSDDDSGGEGGQSGSAGTSGSAASGSAGSSSAGSSSGGASGGSGGSSGGAGSNAGGGGSATVEDVYNPALPRPSRDCKADGSPQCLAISGTLLGSKVDESCVRTSPASVLLGTPPAWPVACQGDSGPNVGLFYQVSVPAQQPGSFHYKLEDADQFAGADVAITKDDVGGDGKSDHLKVLEMAGTISADAASGGKLVVGTFRATWDTPGQVCSGGVIGTCGAADVHGSFRFINTKDIE